MTTTATPPRQARAEAAHPTWPGDPTVPLRRSRARLVLAVVLVLLGGWVAAVVVQESGDRVDVVALARAVERYGTIERADLEVVRVAPGPVPTVPAERVDDLVGRVARSDLVEGSLLAPNQLVSPSERLVSPSEAVVGALLAPGDAPGTLSAGDEVLVVTRPGAGAGGDQATSTAGWALEVGSSSASSGDRPVSVVVPAAVATDVSAAAADRRVSVVVVGGS